MSLDSIGPILDTARTQLELTESMEAGTLVGPTGAKATAEVEAVAATTTRFTFGDPALPDGMSPVKLTNGQGTFELTTDEATVAAGDLFWQAADGLVSKTPSPGLMFECVDTPTGGTVVGTKKFEARLRTDRFKPIVHVVDAAEAAANSASIATGFGSAVRLLGAPLVNNAIESGWSATANADGTVTFAATSLSENDVITFMVAPTAA